MANTTTDGVEVRLGADAGPLKSGMGDASASVAASLKQIADAHGAVWPRASAVHRPRLVSRGGRPDLAGGQLGRVRAPTLLIVGSDNFGVLELNRYAMRAMHCTKNLSVVAGANNSFDESDALDAATNLAGDWFQQHLGRPALH